MPSRLTIVLMPSLICLQMPLSGITSGQMNNSVKDNFSDLLLLCDLLMCIFQISYQCPRAMADVEGGGKGIENAMTPPQSVAISTSRLLPVVKMPLCKVC